MTHHDARTNGVNPALTPRGAPSMRLRSGRTFGRLSRQYRHTVDAALADHPLRDEASRFARASCYLLRQSLRPICAKPESRASIAGQCERCERVHIAAAIGAGSTAIRTRDRTLGRVCNGLSLAISRHSIAHLATLSRHSQICGARRPRVPRWTLPCLDTLLLGCHAFGLEESGNRPVRAKRPRILVAQRPRRLGGVSRRRSRDEMGRPDRRGAAWLRDERRPTGSPEACSPITYLALDTLSPPRRRLEAALRLSTTRSPQCFDQALNLSTVALCGADGSATTSAAAGSRLPTNGRARRHGYYAFNDVQR